MLYPLYSFSLYGDYFPVVRDIWNLNIIPQFNFISKDMN